MDERDKVKREDVYRDIFQPMAYEFFKSVNDEDMKTIYEILKKSNPGSFEEAVNNCCGDLDDIDDTLERFGDIFYTFIAENMLTFKLESWLYEVLGTTFTDYLREVSEEDVIPSKRRNGMVVYHKKSRVYEFLEDLDCDDVDKIQKIFESILTIKYLLD